MSNTEKNVHHSLPIPIEGRRRSGSDSDSFSSSDSGSTSPASPVQSPTSTALPRITPISSSTSPILSYFLSSQSPKSPPSATFPFRRGMGAPPLFEEEEAFDSDKPVRHGRRASAAAWPGHDRFPPVAPVAPVAPHDQQERAAGLLRRLSLGGNMTKPPMPAASKSANGSAKAPRSKTPPNTTTNSQATANPMRKARRANTLAPGTSRPPRAPSPMGERILKGHFDGFN